MKRLKGKINRQLIDYVVWGVSTTLVNLTLYTLLCTVIDYRMTNLIAIIVSKVYAYIVNKNFVFHSKCSSMKELLREILKFVLSRGFTGIVDYAGVSVLVEIVNINKLVSKYSITVFVMILNYIFGKYAVFKKGRKSKQ